jgi:hypothetical protein
MTTATASIAQEILKQSILVGVLAIGAYFFYNDNKVMIKEYKEQTQKQIDELREGIKDCNRRNETIMQNQIEKNTHALERVEDCLRNSRGR